VTNKTKIDDLIIDVKAKPGRNAWTAPKNGRMIPTERFIPVKRTPWIEKLEKKHGDIVTRKHEPAKAEAPAAVETDTDASAAGRGKGKN